MLQNINSKKIKHKLFKKTQMKDKEQLKQILNWLVQSSTGIEFQTPGRPQLAGC